MVKKKKKNRKKTPQIKSLSSKSVKNNIKCISDSVVWALVLGCLFCIMIFHSINNRNLLKHSQCTTAIITRINTERTSKYNRSWFIYYQYQINGEIFEGDGYKYKHHKVGDTVLIVYDTTNYKNSKTYLDLEERNIKKKDLLPSIPDSLKKWY